LGTAHDLLDKAIDVNSPSAIRQYVRDLEDALDTMRANAAVAAGLVRTLTREKGDLQAKAASGRASITALLAANKEDAARLKASDVRRWEAELAHKQTELDAQTKASTDLDAAVARLEGKHEDMVARVRELERLDSDTKAKEQSAAALTAAGKLVSGGADISVDDIESKMRQRHDVAEEKFNRATGTITVTEDPEHEASVNDLLDELRPKDAAATK
jgi:phage shock protein A